MLHHPRSPTNFQKGQVVRALSSLMRFGQGPSWSPVVTVGQSATVQKMLVQGCRRVQYHAKCSLDDFRIVSPIQKAIYYSIATSIEIESNFVN